MKQRDNLPGYGFGIALAIVGIALIVAFNVAIGVTALVIGLALIGARAYQIGKRTVKSMDAEFTDDDSETYEYSIKGINFSGIDDSYLGDMVGTARALVENIHDDYAIGIYKGSKRVGFIARGNKKLHSEILAAGGFVNLYGCISKGTDETGRSFYYGKVKLLGL